MRDRHHSWRYQTHSMQSQDRRPEPQITTSISVPVNYTSGNQMPDFGFQQLFTSRLPTRLNDETRYRSAVESRNATAYEQQMFERSGMDGSSSSVSYPLFVHQPDQRIVEDHSHYRYDVPPISEPFTHRSINQRLSDRFNESCVLRHSHNSLQAGCQTHLPLPQSIGTMDAYFDVQEVSDRNRDRQVNSSQFSGRLEESDVSRRPLRRSSVENSNRGRIPDEESESTAGFRALRVQPGQSPGPPPSAQNQVSPQFAIKPIEGDGNCFFTAVADEFIRIVEMASMNDSASERIPPVVSHLLQRFDRDVFVVGDDGARSYLAKALRELCVEEWTDNERLYEHFLEDGVDFSKERGRFSEPGYYSSPLGDLAPLAIANIFGVNLMIIRRNSRMPVIKIQPFNGHSDSSIAGAKSSIADAAVNLFYSPFGGGHYDVALIDGQRETVVGTERTRNENKGEEKGIVPIYRL